MKWLGRSTDGQEAGQKDDMKDGREGNENRGNEMLGGMDHRDQV